MKKSNNSCRVHQPLSVLGVVLVCAALGTAQPARADVGPAVQTVATTAPETGHGTVKAGRCNVRSRPSLTAEVVAQFHKGDALDVLERKSVTERDKPMEWLRVTLPVTAKCFVSTKLLTDGAVNVDSLYVRCGPGTNYRDIGKLSKGAKVEVVEAKGEWTQIRPTPECHGWIAAELVDVQSVAAPVATPPPVSSLNTPEVVTPPVAVTTAPAAATPSAPPAVSIVNIDPDVQVQYVVKDGYLRAVTESNAPATYELRTPEADRLSHRVAYLEISDINPKKYEGRHVRVTGNQRWRKGDRDPVIVVERLDIVW